MARATRFAAFVSLFAALLPWRNSTLTELTCLSISLAPGVLFVRSFVPSVIDLGFTFELELPHWSTVQPRVEA